MPLSYYKRILSALIAVCCYCAPLSAFFARDFSQRPLWTPPNYYNCDLSGGIINFGAATANLLRPAQVPGFFNISCDINRAAAARATIGFCLGLRGGNNKGYHVMKYDGFVSGGSGELFYSLKSGDGNIIGGSGSAIPPICYIMNPVPGSNSFHLNYTAFIEPENNFGISTGFYKSTIFPEIRYGMSRNGNYPACTDSAGAWPKTISVASWGYTFLAQLYSSCNLSVSQNINFPTSFDLSKSILARGSVAASCSEGIKYKIGIGTSTGTNQTSRRAMSSGDNRIYYNLYRDPAYTDIYTADYSTAPDYTGTGKYQNRDIYAKTEPNQKAPAGLYRDIVVVELRVG